MQVLGYLIDIETWKRPSCFVIMEVVDIEDPN